MPVHVDSVGELGQLTRSCLNGRSGGRGAPPAGGVEQPRGRSASGTRRCGELAERDAARLRGEGFGD